MAIIAKSSFPLSTLGPRITIARQTLLPQPTSPISGGGGILCFPEPLDTFCSDAMLSTVSRMMHPVHQSPGSGITAWGHRRQ